jgi:hypothetical protein
VIIKVSLLCLSYILHHERDTVMYYQSFVLHFSWIYWEVEILNLSIWIVIMHSVTVTSKGKDTYEDKYTLYL